MGRCPILIFRSCYFSHGREQRLAPSNLLQVHGPLFFPQSGLLVDDANVASGDAHIHRVHRAATALQGTSRPGHSPRL